MICQVLITLLRSHGFPSILWNNPSSMRPFVAKRYTIVSNKSSAWLERAQANYIMLVVKIVKQPDRSRSAIRTGLANLKLFHSFAISLMALTWIQFVRSNLVGIHIKSDVLFVVMRKEIWGVSRTTADIKNTVPWLDSNKYVCESFFDVFHQECAFGVDKSRSCLVGRETHRCTLIQICSCEGAGQ